MKRLMILALALLVGSCGIGIAYAASSANIAVNAQVPNGSPELAIIIKELTQENQEPWTGTTVNEMNFGQLTHTLATGGGDAGVWYSPKYYCVFIFTTSFGNRYEIRSTCIGLSSGANSLPAGSFGLVPGYAAEDEWSPGNAQGIKPVDAVLGDPGPAILTDKVIYRSEAGASNRMIRAFYSLPCYTTGGADPFPGYKPIPLSQAAGTYTGTVTISIVAI